MLNRLFSTVLIAGGIALAGSFPLWRSLIPVMASEIEVVSSKLFYLYKGQPIYLEEQPDTIAVSFKSVSTRGTAQPFYLQLQQSLNNSNTRSTSSAVQVSPIGTRYAIVRFSNNARGIGNQIQTQVQQQPYVAETLPVLSRVNQSQAIVLPNEIIVSFQPGLSDRQKQDILSNNQVEVIQPFRFAPNRYLVRAKSVSGTAILTVANQLNQVAGVRSATPNFIQTLSSPVPQLNFNRTASPTDFQEMALSNPSSRSATPAISPLQWHLYSPPLRQCLQKSPPPSNLAACLQQPPSQLKATLPRTDLRIPEAWKSGNQGQGTVVAILDSLIQWDHPDLIGNVYQTGNVPDQLAEETKGWDFAEDDPDTRISPAELAILQPYFRDSFELSDLKLLQRYSLVAQQLARANPQASEAAIAEEIRYRLRMRRVASEFHGTWTAGVVAANSGSGVGLLGVAPRAKILPVRIGSIGPAEGINAGAPSSNPQVIIDAIGYAAARGADVINLSFRYLPDAGVADQIADVMAANPNLVIVASAGNGSCDIQQVTSMNGCSEIGFPANLPGVLVVGATGLTGNRTSYSDFGSRLDVVAPGGEYTPFGWIGGIPTTGGTWLQSFWQGIPAPKRIWAPVLDLQGKYWWVEGTSFSSPAVAGVVALMKSEDPQRQLNRDKLITILKSTASYGGLTLTKEETNLYRSASQNSKSRLPTPPQQYFFGSGLVNADAAVQGVKRSLPVTQ